MANMHVIMVMMKRSFLPKLAATFVSPKIVKPRKSPLTT